MSEFTPAERLKLEDYVTDQLNDISHIHISEISFFTHVALIQFNTTPVYMDQPHYSYKIFIFKNQDLYYINFQEWYFKTFLSKPVVEQQLYEIEDIDDVFNVLEDIFDTLRPRDEY